MPQSATLVRVTLNYLEPNHIAPDSGLRPAIKWGKGDIFGHKRKGVHLLRHKTESTWWQNIIINRIFPKRSQDQWATFSTEKENESDHLICFLDGKRKWSSDLGMSHFFNRRKKNDPLIWEVAEPSCNRWAPPTNHEMGKEGCFEKRKNKLETF